MESSPASPHPIIVTTLLLSLVILACGFIYAKGTNGGFILDDQANLAKLTLIKEEPSFSNRVNFTLEGISSRLGRPISLATFAAQAESWPNPKPFKYVNIFIHLCNGILIFAIFIKLLSIAKLTQRNVYYLSFFIAAAWLLHPMQTSTVLYVIQRMAQLSTFFTLIGLLCYLHGRILLSKHRSHKVAFTWMVVATGLFTPLAIFSKENGVLLPLYILLIEFTLFSQESRSKAFNAFITITCALPILMLFGYLLSNLEGYHAQYIHRDFSMHERLLTEPRVLIDYLQKTISPNPMEFGLYHDDFQISKDFFSPFSTATSIITILILITLSILVRKKHPLLAFGILFFFSAHLLESTFLPLEIYFEHRNYLAILGPLLILFYLALLLHKQLSISLLKKLTIPITGTFALLIFITNTLHQVEIWSTPFNPTFVWKQERPESKRAKYDAAAILAKFEKYEEAQKVYLELQDQAPNDISPYLGSLLLGCYNHSIPKYDIDKLIKIATNSRYTTMAHGVFNKILIEKTSGNCKHIADIDIDRLLDALTNNIKYKHNWHSFFQFRGMLEANKSNYITAAKHAERGLSYRSDIRIGLHQVKWLFLAGHVENALSTLSKLRALNKQNTLFHNRWGPRLNEWEQFLTDHLNNQESAASIPASPTN